MSYSTDIKFFSYTNSNLANLDNTWGALIPLLDICLVNGGGAIALSGMSISGTRVTVTTTATHNLINYQVVRVSGSGIAELDKDHRIISLTGSTFDIELGSAITPPTDISSIVVKLAPLGYEKSFTGTNKAAYRSTDTALVKRPYLRLEDGATGYTNGAKYARVGIVDNMSGIDTLGSVQAPYDSSATTKNWDVTGTTTAACNGWAKWLFAVNGDLTTGTTISNVPPSGDRKWWVVGNGKYFYLLVAASLTSAVFYPYFFGDIGDKLGAGLSATLAYNPLNAHTTYGVTPLADISTARFVTTTSLNQSNAYITLATYGIGGDTAFKSGASTQALNNPICSDVYLFETAYPCYRSIVPGLKWFYSNLPYANQAIAMIDNNPYLTPYVVNNSGGVIGQIGIKLADLL